MKISMEAHPLLEARAFLSRFKSPLETLSSPEGILKYFALDCPAPVEAPPGTKPLVRDLLRHGGFKPTGRSKPASEYLFKAIEKGWFSPNKGINLAVDACNVVSLRSGLPISVVDADLLEGNLSIETNPEKTEYIFNPSGQGIDVGLLFGLKDEKGPCAGPVKDSQRTKTHGGTQQTLSILWGTRSLPNHTENALCWYLDLLSEAGAEIEAVDLCL